MTLKQFNIIMVIILVPTAILMGRNFYVGSPVSQAWLDSELHEVSDLEVRERIEIYVDLVERAGTGISRQDFYRLKDKAEEVVTAERRGERTKPQ